MLIRDISTTAFKSDYYGLKKISQQYYLNSIKTDDKPKAGEKLVLQYTDIFDSKYEKPMVYDGKYYTHNFGVVTPVHKYKILNKDNEPEPREIELDELAISRNAAIYDKISSGKPLVKNISEGCAEGIIITDKNNVPNDKPVILILGEVENSNEGIFSLIHLPENVKGIIVSNASIGLLSHAASLSTHYYDLMSVVYDDKILASIHALEGQKVRISNKDGEIKTEKIEKFSQDRTRQVKTPKIPILDNEEILLDYNDLTRKNSGEKAYRIGVMHKLSEQGALPDITIPAGFVVPAGYINKIYEFLTKDGITKDDAEYKERLKENPFIEEIKNMSEKNGIELSNSIFRSAFNAEDLSDYPTAGIYDSKPYFRNAKPIKLIIDVAESKDSDAAKLSRQRYNVPDSIIQPNVIVQNHIYPDYKFTAYTSDKDGRFKIEIGDTDIAHTEPDSAVVIYDRNSKSIKLETSQNHVANYLVKDDGDVIEQNIEKDRIQKEWSSLLAPLSILVAGALKLEKYFGAPQDIEGGIKDGKVYFWQTRDIIKKVIK